VDHDEVLVFQPVPLFVLIARFISEDHMFAAYGEAIGDGVGDPEDLSPRDDAQTVRLESAILSRTDGILAIRELISVEWFDYDSGPRSVSLCMAYTPEDGLLVVHDPDGAPSMQVIALGPERALQAVCADESRIVLPRLGGHAPELREVVVRYMVSWTFDGVVKIVEAVVGAAPLDGHILRRDLLSYPDVDEADLR